MAHAAKTDAADAELSHVAARSPAQVAAVFNPRRKLRFDVEPLGFSDLTGLGHKFFPL